MGNVIDVSGSGESEATVLTRTETSGVLGGKYLRSEPLAAYLGDTEEAKYVVRNKKSGLRIEASSGATENPTSGVDGTPGSGVEGETAGREYQTPEEQTPEAQAGADRMSQDDTSQDHTSKDHTSQDLEPASDYQALAAITDVRLVFVVGTADGDRSVSIPLSDVATVDVESGLFGSELSITTVGDDRYGFPCRGNLKPIAEYVDRGSQAWTRAYSLHDAAREAIQDAEAARRDAAFDDAIDAIQDGVAAVADARDRLAAFGDGALSALDPEVEELRRTLEQRRREIHAEHGVHAHERARRHWGNREYERAHEAYQEAITALERAQELEATAGIADRLDRIDDELDDLADAPLSYASAMVEEAEDSEDPWTTAQCWEVAIERYRDVYALDWGRSDERFRGDPVEIREHVLAAVEELVEQRLAGVEDRLEEAEWLRQSGDVAGAREVLEDTLAALDRTDRLVDELSHETYPDLDAARAEVAADHELVPAESE